MGDPWMAWTSSLLISPQASIFGRFDAAAVVLDFWQPGNVVSRAIEKTNASR
jgi:hypothetical protein